MYNKLKNVKLDSTDIVLHTYSKQTNLPKGKCKVDVDKHYDITVIVVDTVNQTALLGRNWLQPLPIQLNVF